MKWLKSLGVAAIGALAMSLPTQAQEPQQSEQFNFIEEAVIVEGEEVGIVRLVDWATTALSDFPPIQEAGFISSEFDDIVGYALGREWEAGAAIIDVLQLGDVEEAFALQEFNLTQIAELTNLDLGGLGLDTFALIEDQSISTLLEVSSDFGLSTLAENQFVSDFLESQGVAIDALAGINLEEIGNIIDPAILDTVFEVANLDLSEFALESIVGLADIQLGDLENWQSALISQIPGLSEVFLSDFPNAVENLAGIISRIDYTWTYSSGRLRTVSGGRHDPRGLFIPCPDLPDGGSIEADRDNCPSIELDDLENIGRGIRLPFEGNHWLAGRDFQTKLLFCPRYPWGVEGGFGPLKFLNICGREPTGRHPFGRGFKQVITDVDEVSKQVDSAIFFRVCAEFIVGRTCSPYFIGPIPFIPYQEGEFIFLGESVTDLL